MHAARTHVRTPSPTRTVFFLAAMLVSACAVVSFAAAARLPFVMEDSRVYFGGIVSANGRFGKQIHHFPNTDPSLRSPPVANSTRQNETVPRMPSTTRIIS